MNGIINVYKEPGFTSFDVVAKLKGMLKTKKIGHTGTLDPEAVGVLPICVGNATKVCDLLMDETKEYIAVLRLGMSTDTLDTSGVVVNENEALGLSIGDDEIQKVVNGFLGEIEQIPPMYSALKVNGKRLYELARAGENVERKPRRVRIFEIEILEPDFNRNELLTSSGKKVLSLDDFITIGQKNDEKEYRKVFLRVVCSKGTYIRTLCDDIGNMLGCGGCMEALVRTRVGMFEANKAYRLMELQKLVDDENIEKSLISVDSIFDSYPKVYVKEEGYKALVNGNQIPENYLTTNEQELKSRESYRVYNIEGRFFGIYEYHSGWKVLKPLKMFL